MNKEKEKKIRVRTEDDFSSELRVMAKIYEYTEAKKKPIWGTRIKNCFRGKLASGVALRALYVLEGLRAINVDNKLTKINGKYVHLISLTSEPKEYAKEIYGLIEKVRRKEDITEDLIEIKKRQKKAEIHIKKNLLKKARLHKVS